MDIRSFGLEYFLFINIESNWIGMEIIVLKNRPNLPGLKSNNQQINIPFVSLFNSGFGCRWRFYSLIYYKIKLVQNMITTYFQCLNCSLCIIKGIFWKLTSIQSQCMNAGRKLLADMHKSDFEFTMQFVLHQIFETHDMCSIYYLQPEHFWSQNS